MRMYDKEKILLLAKQAEGNAMTFVNDHESTRLEQLKAKFYMDNLIIELSKILEEREKR